MKPISILIISLSLLLSACSKDGKKSNSPNTTPPITNKAKVDPLFDFYSPKLKPLLSSLKEIEIKALLDYDSLRTWRHLTRELKSLSNINIPSNNLTVVKNAICPKAPSVDNLILLEAIKIDDAARYRVRSSVNSHASDNLLTVYGLSDHNVPDATEVTYLGDRINIGREDSPITFINLGGLPLLGVSHCNTKYEVRRGDRSSMSGFGLFIVTDEKSVYYSYSYLNKEDSVFYLEYYNILENLNEYLNDLKSRMKKDKNLDSVDYLEINNISEKIDTLIKG